MKERIEIFIEGCRDEMLSDIVQLIKFRSIEGNDEQISGALEFVLARAREMGFEVKKLQRKMWVSLTWEQVEKFWAY